MNPQSTRVLQAKIAQIKATGEVAKPKTWIAASTVTKPSGKRYTYYRLMEVNSKRSQTGSVQGKMVRYLGNEHNPKYKEMKGAIQRRNQIQALERKLKKLREIEELKVQPMSKKRSNFNPLPTTDHSLLLHQLQQQLQELMRRFEGVEEELTQLKGKWDSGLFYGSL